MCPIEISSKKVVLEGKNFGKEFAPLVPPIYAYGHTDTSILLIMFMRKHEFLSQNLIQNCCSLVSRHLRKFLTSTVVYYDRRLQMFWRIKLRPFSLQGDSS
jgi:hypothetical protein